MKDTDEIRAGFDIFERYDDDAGGDVSVTDDREIFAGPEGKRVGPDDADRLKELGWHFCDKIERWYWQ